MPMDTDLKEFLLSRSLEGIAVLDLEGTILQVNATACDMLGYTESELQGQFVACLFPPQSVPHLLPNLLHLAVARGFGGDIILQDSTGETVMVRLQAETWPASNPYRLLLRFLDWRETHQIIDQLKEATQMASLGTLTRSLSHEILNPVSVIGGCTRRLLDSLQAGSREEEWARQVLAGVDRLESMLQTINAYLSLPTPSFEKGSLREALLGSLEGIREEAEKRGVRITRETGAGVPPIFMDASLLRQAFTAVLLNAVDRMPKGGDLTLNVDRHGDLCRVRIEDSGPALDTMQMEEDLSPVHIMGAHRTHLNLAIARRIVDEHGGRFDTGVSGAGGLSVSIRLPTDRRALAREREM